MEINFHRSEELGKGGYGYVYKGFWGDQPVAVKRIDLFKITSDEQEEKILQRLNHENVIKLFHAESDENFRYYALELCEASLDKLFLPDGDPKIYMGPIPSPENVLRQMAIGLAYIHGQGLAHRDVKPENVLISSTNDVVRMKWADFGLSKAVNKKGSYARSGVQGTKKWLAPELLESSSGTALSRYQRSTVKSDVFAEGSVFAYFLSDGQHPFGNNRSDISENVQQNNPVNLGSIPSLHAKKLIEKMLAKNPEERISSSDVVEELENINDQLKEEIKNVDSMIPSIDKTNKMLGYGGFTSGYKEGVWEGVWRRQKVAVKKMIISDLKKLCHEREENLLKLNHRNVVKMYHIESDLEYRYFALELCEASLDKLLWSSKDLENYNPPRLHNRPMPQPRIVFSQLAEGMAYIHKMGMTHRDVKPLNVLIYVKNWSEQIYQVILKWADFGTSKKVNTTGECSMSKFKFTEKWCAPEVLKIYENSQSGGKTERCGTIQSDVFSEGLVFSYYLLKGEHMYGNNRIEVQSNLLNNKPQKLNEIPTKHQMFKELITTMLKTNPFERPSSKEVADKLASSTFVNVSAALRAASDSTSSIKIRSIQIDKETILGRGTFGVVFMGNYNGVGPVAIKRIQLDDFNDREETQTIVNKKNNTCQNIVKLYHVENDDDFKYFALELCAASLDKLFLPENDSRKYNGQKPNIFEVMSQLAYGMEYIHSKNIVYRDIKPENVLISVDTTIKKITLKWADFGFTKRKSELGSVSFSRSTNQISNWLAPELLEQSCEERTVRHTKMSDIFAEGLLFCYFLLEGQHPFGSSHFEIWYNIPRNKKINFEKIESSCCRDIIWKMLELNPKDRITSSELFELIQIQEEELEVTLFSSLEETPLNPDEIEKVIREGVNINCVNENGLTPLFCLIEKQEDDLMQVIPLFLQHGIDVNHKDEEGWNVLFFLCHYYHESNLIDIIRLLIEHDIDVNCKDSNGKNVLQMLCRNDPKENLVEIIRLLTAHDFDVNLKNKENILHFYCAEYKGENFIDIVKIFIERGVEVVSGGVDARRMIRNKKYPKRSNVEKIIELMDTKC